MGLETMGNNDEAAQAGNGSANAGLEQQSGSGHERRGSSDRRQSVLDQRCGLDRRRQNIPVAVERRSGQDRRRGPGIRRAEERRAAEEGEMTDEQFEFIKAVDKYKRLHSRPFPSLTEVLEIAKRLGYKKVT